MTRPQIITANGNAQISTAQNKFGGSSIVFDGSGDYLTIPSTSDFAFGTGDFTIECWIRRSVSNVQHNILDFRTTNTQNAPVIYIQSNNVLSYYVNGAVRITGTSISANTWHHIALSKSGTSTKMFLNGTQIGSTWTDSTNYIQSPLVVGSRFDGTTGNFNGYIDEVRISKGVARYTANFTPSTLSFTDDVETVLLVHADGINGSNKFIDSYYDGTQTDSDRLYIEDSYFNYDGYYVYIAEAVSAQSAEFSVACDATLIPGGEELQGEAALEVVATMSIDAVKIVDSVTAISSEFTQTVAISNIYGADLFAFSDAQLAAQVDVIRDYNVTTSSQFDLATDFVRTLVADSFVSSEFAETVSAERSRDFAGQFEAAFSFDSTAESTKEFTANLSTAFTQTASARTTKRASAALSVQSSIVGSITRVSRYIGEPDVNQGGTRYTPLVIDTGVKKFGTGSLDIQTDDAIVQPESRAIFVSGTTWKLFSTAYTWTTTDNGVTWSRASNNLSSFATADVANIKYRNSTYITVSGTKLCYSTNGTTWQETAAISGSRTVRAVEYSNSLWMAVVTETTGMFLFTSSDLSTWTQRTSDSSGSYTNVANIILATNGSASILSWSATSSGVTNYFTRRSTNATTWTGITILPANTDYSFRSIALSGTNAVVGYRRISTGVNYTKTSSDSGATWSTAYDQGSTAIGLSGFTRFGSNWYTFISAEGKSYASANNGQTWTAGASANLSVAEVGTGILALRNGEYFLTTSDASTFTRTEIGDLENWPGYVEYPLMDFSDWQTIDFWFYASTTASTSLFGFYDLNSSQNLRVGWSSGRITLFGPIVNGTTIVLQSGTGLGNSTWHHVRISFDGSTAKLYINGATASGTGVIASATYSRPTISGVFRLADGGSTPGGAKIDELLITSGLLTPIANNSYTTPTAEYTNTDNTRILLHFNGTFADDNLAPPRTQQGAANLSVVGGFNLSAKVTTSADIDLAATTALNVDADVTLQGSATLASEFAQTANVNRIRAVDSQQSSEFSQTTDIDRIRSLDSQQSSEFTQTSAISVTRDAEIATDSIASQLTAVAKIGDFLVGLDVYFTSEQSAVKTVDPTSTLASEFSQTTEATRALETTADLASEFAQSTAVDKFVGYSSDLVSLAELTVEVSRTQQGSADLDSEFALTATATESSEFSAALVSEFAQTIQEQRVRFFDSQQSSEFSQTTLAEKSVEATSTQSSEFAQTAEAVKTVNPEISTDSIATQLTAVAKVGDFLVDMASEFAQSTDAEVIAGSFTPMSSVTEFAATVEAIRDAQSAQTAQAELTVLPESTKTFSVALNVQSTLTATAVKDVEAIALVASFGTLSALATITRTSASDQNADSDLSCDIEVFRAVEANLASTATQTAAATVNYDISLALSAFNSQLTVARIIHIDPDLTYKIPAENRSYKITVESRDYTVLEELREYII